MNEMAAEAAREIELRDYLKNKLETASTTPRSTATWTTICPATST